MSVILARTISAVTEKCIVLSNSQFARALPFGTTWNAIRIGVRLHMRDSGANLTSTPRLWLGVCSGTSNLVSDSTTTNFAGLATAASTWTRSATDYSLSTNGYVPATRVNTTNSLGGGGTALSSISFLNNGAASNAADRTLLFLDITKGSPNYTYRLFSQTSSAAADQSVATFLQQMELATPSLTGHTFSSAIAFATSQAAGNFDNLNISWERSTPQIEICDLALTRFS